MITVALPVFNSKHIVWLAIESLCRQKVDQPWELIIAEEQNGEEAGKDFFRKYYNEMHNAGCVDVKYQSLKEWIPLAQKWKMIGELAHHSSKVFILQAADCYSEPHRLQTAWNEIEVNGADWLQSKRGPFYNIRTGQIILYEHYKKTGTGLNMATKTKHARNLPLSTKRKGVDSWFLSTIKNPNIKWDESENYKQGVDTDTYNNISRKRVTYYDQPQPPFHAVTMKIQDILPAKVANTLYEMNGYITERQGEEITFVYPYLGNTAQGREIMYSIRSIEKHCKHPYQIAIVGDLPYYLKDVIHIKHKHRPSADFWKSRHRDITQKMKLVIESEQIPDKFIWMYDDIYFMQNFGIDDIRNYAVKPASVSPTNGWRKSLKETIAYARENLQGSANYETHLPRILEKEKLHRLISEFALDEEHKLLHFTLYFNRYNQKPVAYRDDIQARVTCKLNHMNDYVERTNGKTFFNHNELAWSLELEQFLKMNFSYKSKYEIMKTDVSKKIALWLQSDNPRFADGVDLLLKVEKKENIRMKFAREKIKEIKRGKPIKEQEEAFGMLKKHLSNFAAKVVKPKQTKEVEQDDDKATTTHKQQKTTVNDDLGTSKRMRVDELSKKYPGVQYDDLPKEQKTAYNLNKVLIKELSAYHAQMKRDDITDDERKIMVEEVKRMDDKMAANHKILDDWYANRDKPQAKKEEPKEPEPGSADFEKKVKAAENYIYRYRNDEKKAEKVKERKEWLESAGRPYQRKNRK